MSTALLKLKIHYKNGRQQNKKKTMTEKYRLSKIGLATIKGGHLEGG